MEKSDGEMEHTDGKFMKIYSTLGFLFTPDFQKVLLIRKQKPAHHKGLLNGLGGKFEKDENALSCIVREVEEESGLHTQQNEWKKVGLMQWQEWHVEIFAAMYTGKQKLSEKFYDVAWYSVKDLPADVLTNLPWLIPMCIDALSIPDTLTVHIQYE